MAKPDDTGYLTTSSAVGHLCSLQHPDGRWEGEMAWNTMLLSQYVLTCRVVGRWPLSQADADGVLRHYRTGRLPDGSWPMHRDGPGSVYVTTLAYVALRVMGVPADAGLVAEARGWLHAQPGGVPAIPAWGRMWLAVLGLYDYAGINPVPPELALLPRSAQVHPERMYCHTRYVYLGLAVVYGLRARFDLGPLTGPLRQELYDKPYESIDFAGARRLLSPGDGFAPPHPVLRAAHRVFARYERRPVRALRGRALRRCARLVEAERSASRGLGLSPVNALLGCLVMFFSGRPRAEVADALSRVDAWRWEDEKEGVRIAGARSSSWDTAFAMRALLGAPPDPEAREALIRGYAWLAAAQERGNLDSAQGRARDSITGGWCFSDGAHRWPVSDCTAEALSTVLLVHRDPGLRSAVEPRVGDDRLFEAVEFILARQNRDGGFGTYERARAPLLLEKLNPSEMYANCMTDQSHVECTASCVAALCRFREQYPDHRRRVVDVAVERGLRFITSRQRADGSYQGAWGINFTYAAFFALEALAAAGVPRSDPAMRNAARWLLSVQKDDGGWGEHYSSCRTGAYAEHPHSQAAMTAWALLALRHVVGPDHPSVARGLRRLSTLSDEAGSQGWPQQAGSGVFFATAVLDYRLYKEIFPTWALTAFTPAEGTGKSR